ncbi:hypothetical protein [Sedimentibacter sp. MB31-C6]|uniref:hypothetical protein n=1 Tax=Sedimentibacter sp. MB31-C6 TaxID=3109366 RepID=UPI002DDD1DD9|nr:hypothetical protein [Sedimentibacter sp. MB36-C1]WSI04923.1 hypothetical protein U8307_03790 [Sedimentibacter sp. MB36-C1]
MKNKSSINLEVSLIEIILSILIFAIAAVIILNCFAIARYTQIKSNDKTIALMKMQTILEYINSSETDNDTQEILNELFAYTNFNEETNQYYYVVYFDSKWNRCNEEQMEYTIIMDITNKQLQSGIISHINIFTKKSDPYPFIENNNSIDSLVSISTKNFYPDFEARRALQ